MFNIKDHKGRTRGPLVVSGPQFEKRWSSVSNLSFVNCYPSDFPNKNLTQLDLSIQNICILVTIQNEPHVHMNVFNHNGPYHHLRTYLTFLQNYPVYGNMRKVKTELNISHRQRIYYFQTVYEQPDSCPQLTSNRHMMCSV